MRQQSRVGTRNRFMRLVVVSVVLLGSAVAAGCGGRPQGPALADEHRCEPGTLGSIAPPPDVEFSCASLAVPLDHGLLPGARSNRQLVLPVAMTDNPVAPRGVLIWLNGGPGSSGVGLAGEIANQFDPAVLRDYRLVLFSQRGTGPNALRCPRLQQTVSSSMHVPPAGTVEDCARVVGPDRRFFATSDTVEDLEDLRRALGVDKLTVAGASYGTVPAARYAIKYPDRVARLVLDSVVPHDGLDPLMLDVFARATQLLRGACARPTCPTDPAADLADVIRLRHNGLDMLGVLTRLAPTPRLAQLPAALREAAQGDNRDLDQLSAAARKPAGPPPPPEKDSRGLNLTTACEDMNGPWGGSASPVAVRAQAAARAAAALPDQEFFPFDRATALENPTMVSCERFPTTSVPLLPVGLDLPPVPTLLLAGEKDLTTPLGWTRKEAARAPHSHLVVIPGAGHITQDLAYKPGGRNTVTSFLEDRPS